MIIKNYKCAKYLMRNVVVNILAKIKTTSKMDVAKKVNASKILKKLF